MSAADAGLETSSSARPCTILVAADWSSGLAGAAALAAGGRRGYGTGLMHKPTCFLRCWPASLKNYMAGYTGPLPPSGGTQTIFCVGSLMSQALQWMQFCALICRYVASGLRTIS